MNILKNYALNAKNFRGTFYRKICMPRTYVLQCIFADSRNLHKMRMVTGGYAGTGYWSPWYLVLGPLVPGSGWREGGTEHISKN